MEEIPSLREIGSIISGREAARHVFSIARILATLLKTRAFPGHTGGNLAEPELMSHVAIPFIWNNSYFTDDAHANWNQSWRRGSSQGEKKAKKDDEQCSSLPWIFGEMRLKKKSKVTCRNQERYALGTPSVGHI